MDVLTLRQIAQVAQDAGERWITQRRLQYVVECYNIAPAQRAGAVKLYFREDIPRILSAARRVRGGQRE